VAWTRKQTEELLAYSVGVPRTDNGHWWLYPSVYGSAVAAFPGFGPQARIHLAYGTYREILITCNPYKEVGRVDPATMQ